MDAPPCARYQPQAPPFFYAVCNRGDLVRDACTHKNKQPKSANHRLLANLGTQLLYALLGGSIPALIWLYFWLREDTHPEPKRLILKAFMGGVLAIPFALLLEALVYCGGARLFLTAAESRACGTAFPPFIAFASAFSPIAIVAFAAAEEYVKYKAAKIFVLKGKEFDEPVDAMIYLITAALGFAAFENFFFLISAFGKGVFEGLVVGNLRFLGATLLHALSSGIVGYAIALSFYANTRRKLYTAYGLVLATALHAVFNFTIMNEVNTSSSQDTALFMLLLTGILLIFAFDRAKKIKQLTL